MTRAYGAMGHGSRSVRTLSTSPTVSSILAAVMILAVAGCHRADSSRGRVSYPPTHKGDVVDDYGGVKLADPYRWMEALDSKEVADWVKAQNAVTEPYLANLPLRKHFQDRLTQLWDYARVGMLRSSRHRMMYRLKSVCA